MFLYGLIMEDNSFLEIKSRATASTINLTYAGSSPHRGMLSLILIDGYVTTVGDRFAIAANLGCGLS